MIPHRKSLMAPASSFSMRRTFAVFPMRISERKSLSAMGPVSDRWSRTKPMWMEQSHLTRINGMVIANEWPLSFPPFTGWLRF